MMIYVQSAWLWAIGIIVSFVLFLRTEKVKEYFWNSGFMVAIWPIRLTLTLLCFFFITFINAIDRMFNH